MGDQRIGRCVFRIERRRHDRTLSITTHAARSKKRRDRNRDLGEIGELLFSRCGCRCWRGRSLERILSGIATWRIERRGKASRGFFATESRTCCRKRRIHGTRHWRRRGHSDRGFFRLFRYRSRGRRTTGRCGCCDFFGIFILVATAKEGCKKGLALAAGRGCRRSGASCARHLDRRRADTLLVVSQSLVITRQRLAIGGKVNGVAVREDANEFLAAHARPCTDIADIHMDEGRTGGRVEADAADLHLHADLTKAGELHAGNEKVHRLAERVLAVLGNTLGARTQHAIGLRRAESGNDVDIVRGAGAAIHFPDQIEKAWIHLGGLVATPVAQEAIEFLQALLIVLAVSLECDDGFFFGVDIIELQTACLGGGFRR